MDCDHLVPVLVSTVTPERKKRRRSTLPGGRRGSPTHEEVWEGAAFIEFQISTSGKRAGWLVWGQSQSMKNPISVQQRDDDTANA